MLSAASWLLCRALKDKAQEFEILDLQILYDSDVFQAAGFEVASDGETISLLRGAD